MKLIEQLVNRGLKNYLDEDINGKIAIWKFYKIHNLSLVAMGKTPEKSNILNRVWRIYNRVQNLRRPIEVEINKRILNSDFHDVNLFLKKAKSVISQETSETDFSQVGVIGIASWSYDD